MNRIEDRVIEVDPQIARTRNKRNLSMILGLTVLGAALVAGLLLVPSLDVVKGQLDRETAQRTGPVGAAEPKTPNAERAQVLAGSHGTTIIVGNVQGMVGTDTDIMDIVNAKSPQGFPATILVRNAEVQTVPGDQVFSIGPTPANSVLVKIEEPTQPGNLSENALVVRPGQKVAVSGRVVPLSNYGGLRDVLGVTGYEAGRLGNTAVVIQAQTVQILP
jgi:hypothetical protein